MKLRDERYFCGVCQTWTDHARALVSAYGPEVTAACTACGTARDHSARHYAYRMRATACGLPMDGRPLTLRSEDVECPDCVLAMLELMAEVPTPDWRPGAPIAEDYYAA